VGECKPLPGGDRIIPAQSLNQEAARHFELYHSSRESFLYLKHFYIGRAGPDCFPIVRKFKILGRLHLGGLFS